MSLLLTRHGQTEWNVERKVQGKTDTELSEKGIIQAQNLAKELSLQNIDLILSSPLKRAIQTAEIVAKGRNIDIVCDERLLEREFGELEGRKFDEMDFQDFWDYDKDVKYRKAESIRDFFARIYGFLDTVKDEYPNEDVLLVSHAGVSIPVSCYFNGMPKDRRTFRVYAKKL